MFKSQTGETFSYKSEAVKAALAANAELAQWYCDEHGVDAEWINSLNASNCNNYGSDAHGDLCDMILADAKIEKIDD